MIAGSLTETKGGLWLPPRAAGVLHELMRNLEADPRAVPPHLFVVGPGGTGKSSVLSEATRRLLAAGHEVATGAEPGGARPERGRRFHVCDDVESIAPALAACVTADAHHGEVLVFAFPAHVDADAAAEMVGDLGPHLLLELTHWNEAEIGEQLAAATRPRADARPSVPELHRLTGGFPWLMVPFVEGHHEEMDDAIRTRLRMLTPPARLLVEELAFGLDVESSSASERSPVAYDDLLAEVELAGIMGPHGGVPPVIATVASTDLPLYRRRRLQRRALEVVLSVPDPDPESLRRLATSGLHSPELATALLVASDEAPDTDPDQRAKLLDLAEGAGAEGEPLAVRRAEVALLQGKIDPAVQFMDAALSHGEPSDPDRTARSATTAFMLSGMGPRAAEASRWLGPRLSRRGAAIASLVLTSQGDRDTATQLLDSRPHTWSATLEDGASSLLADALRTSLQEEPMESVPQAVRAASMQAGDHHDKLLPEHPAAIAAVIALQVGDLATAHSVLRPAVGALPPGTYRHRSLAMLTAWTCMLSGDLVSARKWRTTAIASPQQLPSRDRFWDVALGLALARREHDAQALAVEWSRVHDVLLEHPADLFDLLALGEIHIAAIRVRLADQLAPYMEAAWTLLEGMGNPPLWATDLHWSVIQGAILEGKPKDIAPHAAALVRAAPHFPLAAELAAAGKVWVSVLGGEVEVDAVVRAAHRLRDTGRCWEGQRLAGHAAARAKERRDAASLLECARQLGAVRSTEQAPTSDTFTVQLPSGTTHLSRREREVAELVIEGRTYKEIGAVLFLSQRTVEHHVARIRTRFGVSGRANLLEYLRSALAQVPPGQ